MERNLAWIVVIVTTLAAVALGYRQLKVWQWLRQNEVGLSSEDATYHRWSIGRRITGCVLLLLLAAMIAGIYVFDIASGLEELMALGEQAKNTGQKLNEEQERFVMGALRYVITLLLVLMGIFFLVGWDILAIRQFGRRHRQRIRDDRRAMLERQLPILYAERRAMREQRETAEDDAP
jgi:small-conductance mechanosensitive channel